MLGMSDQIQYFEDLAEGDEREMGSFTFTEAEIIEFAEEFDPLPFHIDPDIAEESIFGGLIASGYHTTVKTNRTLVENYFGDTAIQGGLGLDDLRWHAPVRPGDELTTHGVIGDKQAFNAHLGLSTGDVRVVNQTGETVLTMSGKLLFRKRVE